MSPKSTSAMSPNATRCENPIPRTDAQSSTVDSIAPDCATKATPPLAAPVGAKEALSDDGVDNTPRQLGPTMRNEMGRAASSTAC